MPTIRDLRTNPKVRFQGRANLMDRTPIIDRLRIRLENVRNCPGNKLTDEKMVELLLQLAEEYSLLAVTKAKPVEAVVVSTTTRSGESPG